MFDATAVHNVVITKNPRLTRVSEFISCDWKNLEYLEMSYMGPIFGFNIRNTLEVIFLINRTKVWKETTTI